MPWDHRHVLGWYKIIQELKDSGVHVICVFYGQEHKAKLGEVRPVLPIPNSCDVIQSTFLAQTARRKGLRKQDEARGSVEAERLKRLRKLIGVVGEYRSLPRERVIVTLKEIVSNTRKSSAFLSSSVVGSKRMPLGVDDIEVWMSWAIIR
jgi:flap endonuclease-1